MMNKKHLKYLALALFITSQGPINATQQVQVPQSTGNRHVDQSGLSLKNILENETLKDKITDWFNVQYGQGACKMRQWLNEDPKLLSKAIMDKMEGLGKYGKQYAKEVSATAVSQESILKLCTHLPKDLVVNEENKGKIVDILADGVIRDFKEKYQAWKKGYKEQMGEYKRYYKKLDGVDNFLHNIKDAGLGIESVEDKVNIDRTWDNLGFFGKAGWLFTRGVDYATTAATSAIAGPVGIANYMAREEDKIGSYHLKKQREWSLTRYCFVDGNASSIFKWALGITAGALIGATFYKEFAKIMQAMGSGVGAVLSSVNALVVGAGALSFWAVFKMCPDSWGLGGKIALSGTVSILVMIITALIIKQVVSEKRYKNVQEGKSFITTVLVIIAPSIVSYFSHYLVSTTLGFGEMIYIPTTIITYYLSTKIMNKLVEEMGKRTYAKKSPLQKIKSSFSSGDNGKSWLKENKLKVGIFTLITVFFIGLGATQSKTIQSNNKNKKQVRNKAKKEVKNKKNIIDYTKIEIEEKRNSLDDLGIIIQEEIKNHSVKSKQDKEIKELEDLEKLVLEEERKYHITFDTKESFEIAQRQDPNGIINEVKYEECYAYNERKLVFSASTENECWAVIRKDMEDRIKNAVAVREFDKTYDNSRGQILIDTQNKIKSTQSKIKSNSRNKDKITFDTKQEFEIQQRSNPTGIINEVKYEECYADNERKLVFKREEEAIHYLLRDMMHRVNKAMTLRQRNNFLDDTKDPN